MSEEFMIPAEVARRIRRSEDWLAKSRCLGFGPPFVKFGRLVRYRRADVEAWLTSCTRQSTHDERRAASDQAA